MTTIMGLTIRQAHQLLFSLGMIILFAFIVKNVWLTLFIWLSCFLFIFYKFEVGQIYMTNIFYGSVLYYITKLVFEKEHIDWVIKVFLWVVVANLGYSILQLLDFDFIYRYGETLNIFNKSFYPVRTPIGFMGNSGITSALYTFAIPFIATRSKNSTWIAAAMLIPIFILRSYVSLAAAVIVLMFILWFRVNKKIWFAISMILILLTAIYTMYFDMPGIERLNIWKEALLDAKGHPIIGWGMDTFRHITEKKNFVYIASAEMGHSKWDNPHNLLISLFYEFGFLSLLILGGYIRRIIIQFKKSIKDNNTISLAGFILSFFVISMGSFPIFLCRTAVFIIVFFALYEVQVA